MWGNTVAIHSVLKKKTAKLNSQPAPYKKKIDKDNSGKKIIKKEKKTMWGNTVAIHSVLKKNYKAKFSTSSILKKIKSTKTILKKKHKKNEKKKKTILGKKKAKAK
jgi:hypothetical protein